MNVYLEKAGNCSPYVPPSPLLICGRSTTGRLNEALQEFFGGFPVAKLLSTRFRGAFFRNPLKGDCPLTGRLSVPSVRLRRSNIRNMTKPIVGQYDYMYSKHMHPSYVGSHFPTDCLFPQCQRVVAGRSIFLDESRLGVFQSVVARV